MPRRRSPGEGIRNRRGGVRLYSYFLTLTCVRVEQTDRISGL